MKTIILILSILCASLICRADTNILELTWAQPVGYQSTLYTSTNLNGAWELLSTNPPPFTTVSDKSVAFFYVMVAPTNLTRLNYSGGDNPLSISAPSGATFVGTNVPTTFWFKISDDSTNGWIQGI